MAKRHSHLEDRLLFLVRAYGLPEPEKEYQFHPTRKWRFDFAYPNHMIGVEAEGACWVQGRHTRGSGFIKDCEKYNAAALLGWRILRYTTENYHEFVDDINNILKGGGRGKSCD